MGDKVERHARENKAKIGAAFAVSRESIRKSGVVIRTFSDGEELIMAGKASTDKLYRLAVNDTRVGLYAKVSPEIKDTLIGIAKDNDITLGDLITRMTTQIFG